MQDDGRTGTRLYGPEALRTLSASDAVDVVERAFELYHEGRAKMPAKSYVDLPEFDGDFRSMPAYVEGMGACVKWVNSHPYNPERHGLPSVMGVVVYSDPETAYPLAVVDGTS
ncbi:MAG: ornithine cyclodeaminase family protein, partial [Halobacteriales archaeon]